MTKLVSTERLRNTRAWAAARLDSLSGAEVIVGAIDAVLACESLLKEEETPAECIERNRKDADAVLTLLAQEKRTTESLRRDLADPPADVQEAVLRKLNLWPPPAPFEPSVALDYKLPCEVRLPPSMSIGKGCPLSTLMNAFRHREGQNVEFMDARSQAIKEAIKFLGDPREAVVMATPGLLQNADTDDAPCTECNGSGWDRLRERECDCVADQSENRGAERG